MGRRSDFEILKIVGILMQVFDESRAKWGLAPFSINHAPAD